MDTRQLYSNLNEGILAERACAFARNLRKNLPLIGSHGGLRRVIPELDGRTAVVIGAGPSLDKHLDLLRRFQERRGLAYIAADMALRPLMESGVRPGYVFSCETNPADFFRGLRTERMRLMAFSCMSHVNLRSWRGYMSFYNWMIRGDAYDRLWKEAGLDLGFVATGGLVTTQAAAFALGCRISNLVLVGNDLGFRHRFYARGTVHHRAIYMRATRCAPMESLEINTSRRAMEYKIQRSDQTFFTTSQFLAGKMWLEELFSGSRMPVYDASFPGCSDKYVAKIELGDFLYSLEGARRRKRRRV